MKYHALLIRMKSLTLLEQNQRSGLRRGMKEGEGTGGGEGTGTEIGCKINKLNKMKKKDVG